MLYPAFQVVFAGESESHLFIEIAGREIAGDNINTQSFIAKDFGSFDAKCHNFLSYALAFALIKDCKGEITTVKPCVALPAIKAGNWNVIDFPPPVGNTASRDFPSTAAFAAIS